MSFYLNRLEWRSKEEVPTILLLLKNLLKCSDHLERLVLCNIESLSDSERELKCPSNFEYILVDFAIKMDHLVALCLAGFSIDPKVILKVYR